ncbi:hypothetical protein CRENBAI_022253 [Crenichthys baileyi]|uniref:USP domain-containing protein n=1 Tax=Crenichthys baileyi TaxID=28760 RepID=A0AAV9QRC8_9TELE
MNCPEIVTIGFVWDSEQSDLTEEVIRSLGPHLSLSALFYRVTDEHAKKGELLLVGMICYYSHHYCAFAYHTKSSKWVFFDDATVKEIGSRWKDVVSKCIKGHFQPLLLFYSNPDGSSIYTEDASRPSSHSQTHKTLVNGEVPGVESPVPAPKRLELTKENLKAVLDHEPHKKKTTSTLSRGSGQTSGGLGQVKREPNDPKGRLMEIYREVAHKAGESRGMHPVRRDADKGGQRRPDPRPRGKENRFTRVVETASLLGTFLEHRVRLQGSERESHIADPANDRPCSRSASPPENGFKQYLETRLYSSQGKGPIRTERVPHLGGRSSNDPSRPSHDPPRSHTKLQVPPTAANLKSGHQSRRLEHLSNGYDTDSSQSSRGRNGRNQNNPSSRPWRPMREVLNVDSVLRSVDDGNAGREEQRLPSPRRRTGSHSPSRDHEQDRDTTWGAWEERKPKSLMTIYEDEQKNETGDSRSSLDSEGRGVHNDKDRSKNSAPLTVHNENWKIQRTESGYESSDRLSNGSANLDSPVVEGISSKDLQPIPELHLMRDHFPPRGSDDLRAEVLYSKLSTGEQGRKSPDLPDVNVLTGQPIQRKRAFRYTPQGLEKNNGLDSEQEENLDGSPASPIPSYSLKTSSSEWNSSDDLIGPLSELEESGHTNSLLHSNHPPLPPKPSPSGIYSRNQPKNGLPVIRRWMEMPSELRLSSDTSSKSGSSDQERNDLSASENEDRLPSPKPRLDDGTDSLSSSLTDKVLPTTFFSVDGCMTDAYRTKYHKKPGLYRRAEDHTSSGESDAEGRGHSSTNVQPTETLRNRTESGYTAAKWNPVTPKFLDEHGFL